MGVKDLWTVISPVCEKMSLWELRDKKIAIDLSAWVCDSQHLATTQRNMYLRNLFFRSSYLLLSGVHPVFVLEGRPPEIKQNTIRKRIDSKTDDNRRTVRSRLNSLQKQCRELLSTMGVECVEAAGEAEAHCAHLNQAGLVYGVVTQDSDAFLYGARRVLRNFQLGPSYTCDVYSSQSIETKLGLSRSKLVAFSMIAGCDYTSGVNKAGKQSALNFIQTLQDDDIFPRFQSWRKENAFSNLEKNKYSIVTGIELSIREKALRDKNFPDMQVVDEYLKPPQNITLSYTWNLPSLPKFVSLAVRKLGWEEDYAQRKFLPLVTRWHLVNGGADCGLVMKQVMKKRNLKGIHGYDVTWDPHPDLTTTEDRHLVEAVYPHLVQAYQLLTKKPEKEKRGAGRKRKRNVEIPEQRPEPTLQPYLQPTTSTCTQTPLSHQDSLSSYDHIDLNLSDIVQTVVSRKDANPALNLLATLQSFSS